MHITRIALLSVLLMMLPAMSHAQERPAHKDAYLYFVWPLLSKVRSGAASVCAIWASPTPGTILKTPVTIIC